MLLKLAAIALLPAATLAADPTSALDCQNDYILSGNTDVSSSTEGRCQALVTFSKCLSQFPESALMEQKLMENNAKDCEPYWTTDASPQMRVQRNDFQLTVDEAKDIKFFRHRREVLSIFDMNQQIVDLKKMVVDLTTQLDGVSKEVTGSVQTKLDAMKEEQKDNKKDIQDSMNVLKSDVEKSIDGVKDDVTATTQGLISQVNNVKTLVSDSVSKITSDTNKALQAQSASVLSKVDTKVKSLNTTVTAVSAIAKAAKIGNVETPKHMWSGGSKSHARGSGWKDFVMDRLEFDTAAPYFKKTSNTRFQALKTGLFRININLQAHGNGNCWRYMRIMIDGKSITYEHKYVNSWMKMNSESTWLIKAGQQFWTKNTVSSCGNEYTWHQYETNNGYNRIQVEYVGVPEGKCTSSIGLC